MRRELDVGEVRGSGKATTRRRELVWVVDVADFGAAGAKVRELHLHLGELEAGAVVAQRQQNHRHEPEEDAAFEPFFFSPLGRSFPRFLKAASKYFGIFKMVSPRFRSWVVSMLMNSRTGRGMNFTFMESSRVFSYSMIN